VHEALLAEISQVQSAIGQMTGKSEVMKTVAAVNMFTRALRDRRAPRHLDAYVEKKLNAELALIVAWEIVIGANHNSDQPTHFASVRVKRR
jgi:hypothetical protein